MYIFFNSHADEINTCNPLLAVTVAMAHLQLLLGGVEVI